MPRPLIKTKYKLKGTLFKGRLACNVVSKNKEYFEGLVKSEKWLDLEATDRSNIKKYLGHVEHDKETTRDSVHVRVIIELYKNGYTRDGIIQELTARGLGEHSIKKLILTARKVNLENFGKSVEEMIGLHVARYETMYKENLITSDIDKLSLPEEMKKVMRVDRYTLAMDNVRAKEKVLGMHTKRFKVEVNNYFDQQKDKEKDRYDFSLLTLDQMLEFRAMIKKIRQDENEVTIIRPKKEKVEEITQDVEYEEVPTSPLRQVKEVNELAEKEVEEEKNKTLDDVKKEIGSSLKEQLLEELKKIK